MSLNQSKYYNSAKDPQTGNLKILDESHYYPFGLKHQEYVNFGFVNNPIQGVIIAPVANNPYKYKYNGKEWQDELGLGMYDMDMRQYDPAIARWVVMDPVIHHSVSPYSAFDNNPVFWADPSGAAPELGSVFEQSGMKVASLTVQGTGTSIAAGGAGNNNNGGIEKPEGLSLLSTLNNKSKNGSVPDSFYTIEQHDRWATRFVNERGETIVNTDDGSDDVYVVSDENLAQFKKDMEKMAINGLVKDKNSNELIGEKHGSKLFQTPGSGEYLDKGMAKINRLMQELNNSEYSLGYQAGFEGNAIDKTAISLLSAEERATGAYQGYIKGRGDKKAGKMSIVSPKITNSTPIFIISKNRLISNK